MSFVEDFPLNELRVLRDAIVGKEKQPAAVVAAAAITVVSYITGLVFKAIVVRDMLCRIPPKSEFGSRDNYAESVTTAIDSAIGSAAGGMVENNPDVPWDVIFRHAMETVNNVTAPTL